MVKILAQSSPLVSTGVGAHINWRQNLINYGARLAYYSANGSFRRSEQIMQRNTPFPYFIAQS